VALASNVGQCNPRTIPRHQIQEPRSDHPRPREHKTFSGETSFSPALALRANSSLRIKKPTGETPAGLLSRMVTAIAHCEGQQ